MKKFNKKKIMSAVIATSMALSFCTELPQGIFDGFDFPLTVYADDVNILNSGKCGENLTWTLSDYGQLTISGTGNMYNYSYDSLPEWHNNWQEITSVVVSDEVANIGEYAFYECHVLTSVSLPNTITSIEKSAFSRCTSLNNLTIPDSVTFIGDQAIASCGLLTNVNMSNNVTYIGDSAFIDCVNLKYINIPDCVFFIGDNAFRFCENLTSVNIPNNLTSLNTGTFSGCKKLNSVTIPNGVTSIGNFAFYGCKSITELTIPDSVSTMGYSVFYKCLGLTKVTIPTSITYIDSSTFRECDNLNDVYYLGSREQWKSVSIVNSGNNSILNANIHFAVESNDYTIGFDANGGYCTTSSLRTENGKLTNLPIATRNGYIFDGWYTSASGGSEITTSTAFTSNVTVYAHWIEEEYTITFNANGGSCSTASTQTLSHKPAYLPTATRSGYTFDGWYTSENGGTKITTLTVFTSNTTIYAHWTNDEYTITFNANGGSCSTTSTKTLSHKLAYLPTATRSDYTFDGWYTSASRGTKITASTTFTSNTTIYAHWVNNEYTITFNANGGSCSVISTQTLNQKPVNLPTATRIGYIFDGWYTSTSYGTRITASTAFTSSTTVYAHWIKDEYTVTFDANGGNCTIKSSKTSNGNLTSLPDASRTGYKFDGWYTAAGGGVKISTSTRFSYNTTVYAHWAKLDNGIAFYSKTVSNGAKTTNIQKNGYKGGRYSSPMNSYLYENNGYLYRVEYTGTEIILEKYNSSFNFIESKTIEKELAIFGGFFAGDNYNFILFGQNNLDENDRREIIRVVKYTKDMKRVGSKSFYGCNTYIPFDAGCPRMDEYNGVLYIHTSHEMYRSSDGYHHQSNMDFYINISDMKELYSRYDVSNTGTGYMSHSFNQFIKVNENGIYTVDHGDAHNRAITAFRRKNINNRGVDCRDVFKIMGEKGNNVTGVCVGGMELSKENMLIVGTSVPQDSTWGKTKQKNVFVIRKSLSENDSPTVIYLTNYSESANVIFSEPKLVKIDNDKFMIIWSETVSSQTKLYASLLDGSGQKIGNTFSCDGAVSDCQPIIYNGRITFYVTNNSSPTFYYSS